MKTYNAKFRIQDIDPKSFVNSSLELCKLIKAVDAPVLKFRKLKAGYYFVTEKTTVYTYITSLRENTVGSWIIFLESLK